MQVTKFIPICIGILVSVTIGLLFIQQGGIKGIAGADFVNLEELCNTTKLVCNNTQHVVPVIHNNPTPVCNNTEPVVCNNTGPVIPKPSDPSLFVKHNVSARIASEIPDVCVAVLTCKRMQFLNKTIPAFINYFHRVEPNISYEIVLVDNGSGPEYFADIQREFPIDKLIRFDKNYGIAQGMNAAFFGACAAPYILSVEDDWEARWQDWDLNMPVISQSIAIMQNDSEVSEIWLREMGHNGEAHSNRTGWFDLPAKTGVHPATRYRKQYRHWPSQWGAYTNGASLKDRAKLEKVGRMKGVNGEADFAYRVGELGFAAGLLCYKPAADCEPNWGMTEYSRVEPFAHLGWHNRSSGHKDFE